MPWVHEAKRRKLPLAIDDCTACMKTQSRQTRQHMACGFLPPIKGARPWQPSVMDASWRFAKDQPDLTTCPGYTGNLPEVIEVARARVHAKEFGGLREFYDDPLTESARQGIEILEGAANECQGWAMANPEKK